MACRFLALLMLLLGASRLLAQEAAPSPAPPSTNAPPNLREIAPGILEYNGVRLDKKNHRISFPGTLNQREGLIEYLLVNEKGKTYESLFATKVVPHDIHLALLLIGLKEDAGANAQVPLPPPTLNMPYLQSAPKLKGPTVLISVTWTQDGKTQEIPAENWVFNRKTNRPMTSGPWTYNGSVIENGVFLADEESSIVAVVTDPTALVNNPREGYDDNGIWQVRDEVVPPLDTPVEISITLVDPTTTVKP
jgi:hypothetical protein